MMVDYFLLALVSFLGSFVGAFAHDIYEYVKGHARKIRSALL